MKLAGFLLLLDSALHVVDGVPLPEPDEGPGPSIEQLDAVSHRHTDGAVDVSELRYEVMYFMDLDDANIQAFKEGWGEIGDSIVVVGGDGIWNCHVHTNDIGAAIEVALDLDGRPKKIRVNSLAAGPLSTIAAKGIPGFKTLEKRWGKQAPLGWDKAAIDTRVDPSHEQGKLGTTLSRSVPVGDDVSLTLQNGVSMTRSLPNATGQAHSWATSQALRFNFLPTDTSVSFGADISSIDDKWLRSLSAEQKLFGGPFSVTGSVSETATGDLSKSLKAGFKRS